MDQIGDFLRELFYTDSFPARWHCGRWSEFHGWLYIISDLAIWAAYFTIPFLLIHFIRRKKDVPFPKIFWLFGTFILACGTTHLIDAIIFWFPIYRISAVVRLITAIASWGTIYVLYKVLPDAFSLKTPSELEKQVNERTEELHSTIQQMRFMADAMPQMVWTAKPDGNREYFNGRTLQYTGRSLQELSGWKWMEVIHPDDYDTTLKKWKEALNNGTEFEIENRHRAANGEYYWHLTRALPQTDENGNILMWVGTATNIEQHKRAAEVLENKVEERTEQLRLVNDELTQSNHDLEQFAAVASHDLQAPLRTISNYLSMIEDNNHEKFDERTTRYISKTMGAAQRMRDLIENLLDYSRINASKADIKEVDLNQVVKTVLANIEDLRNKNDVQVHFKALPTVYADEIQMSQLFQNLISNGINYNNSNPAIIHIDASEDDQHYIISISDNGVGIPEEYITKIFEVFTRLDSQVKGTGLGLSISKRIIDKHNGKIWVESKLEKGTTFFFTIPKRQA